MIRENNTQVNNSYRPLAGIRVVGLEQYMSGPYCTMLLGDAGAEVIKIERPEGGDPRRAIPPFVEKDEIKKASGFLAYNRNKKSLAVNLQSQIGQDILRKLAEISDVLVENLRPGVSSKMGLDYDSLKLINPRLVYAVISGFGRMQGYQSAYSDRPAFDIVAEAMSGIMDLVGFADKPPTYTLYGLADIYSGVIAAYGIMQALFMRERTGRGQLVDVSMLDNMLALNERMVTLYSATGVEPKRGHSQHFWPRGAFQCRDGYIAVNVPDDIIWQRLTRTIGRPDLSNDPRSATGASRAAHTDFLQPIIEGWMAGKARAEVVDMLNAAGVPAGPVYSARDVFNDAHFRQRKMLMAIDDPEVGPYISARTTPHLSAASEICANPAPSLGQHTRFILQELLAYTPDEVDQLVTAGIVATGD
jgi:CoA:oxalate CoA-transferase